MIMVEIWEGEVYELGVVKVREIIDKWVKEVKLDLFLEKDLFESGEVLDKVCLMSGGYVWDLMFLM